MSSHVVGVAKVGDISSSRWDSVVDAVDGSVKLTPPGTKEAAATLNGLGGGGVAPWSIV